MLNLTLFVRTDNDNPLPIRDRQIAAMLNALLRKGHHGVGVSRAALWPPLHWNPHLTT